MDECGEKNTISLSWGRREIRISGEGATLYVNGVPHDMTMMLETIRGALLFWSTNTGISL